MRTIRLHGCRGAVTGVSCLVLRADRAWPTLWDSDASCTWLTCNPRPPDQGVDMATARAMARTQDELRRRADYGATFGQLLDHLDEQNRSLGSGCFSGDQ